MTNEFPKGLECVQLKDDSSGAHHCNCYKIYTCQERYCSSYKTKAEYHQEQIRCAKRILSLPEEQMFKILRKYYGGSTMKMLKSKDVKEEELYERNDTNDIV